MADTVTLTLTLKPEDYQQLHQETSRLGLTPEDVLMTWLKKERSERADLLEAINSLEKLSETMPDLDAVALIQEAREELDRRIPL